MNFLQKYKKAITAILVILLLGVMTFIMVNLALGDSGTTDEVAHIPAGYSYNNALDFRLNPEHPPLAKALSGVPLQFMSLNNFYDNWSWQQINQWEAGWNFIYKLGNNADQVLFWSRLPIIFLTIVLALFLFFWAKSLYGRKVALFVLALFAFSPEFLAHGHLVTTDVAAALGFVIAIWSYVRFLQKSSWANLVLAGVLFGVAQTLKFSCFLLIPILFLILVGWVITWRENQGFFQTFWPRFGKSFWILLIGLFTIWLIYLPFTWNMSKEVEHQVIDKNLTTDNRTAPFRNFLYKLEGNKITRPLGHYTLGLFLVFGRAGGGNNTYILDHFSDKGIKWYFPVAWLLKTPLVLHGLVILGLVLLLRFGFWGKQDKWQLYYIFVPFAVYWLVTLAGSLNIGVRHLIPTIPFLFLFIGRSVYPLFNFDFGKINLPTRVVFKFLSLIFLGWYILTSILVYPFYLAYFNELTWGKAKHNFLVDSNLDWGQDLKRLATFIDDNQIEKIRIDYFGGSIPNYYIDNDKIIDWHSDQGPSTGWFAISATYFQFSKLAGVQEGKWDYSWLEKFDPITIIGNSILVYNITEEDLKKYPPKALAPNILISPQEAEAKRQKGKVQGVEYPDVLKTFPHLLPLPEPTSGSAKFSNS
ncbi:MAG: glycosyltransferase family 39 protein [Patescibacteria group bacterium]|nr:glycosyltransferase family 39 protein [Patescibacteria group bacterium]